MRCGRCGHLEDKVLDSRASREGTSIRRRRECLGCGHRFTTYEQLDEETLHIVKQDGSREIFDPAKVLNGMLLACRKRPVPVTTLQNAVRELQTELFATGEKEIPSRSVGALVMKKLRDIDPVAFVRFASIYRKFEDVGEFLDEIRDLENRLPKDMPDLFPT